MGGGKKKKKKPKTKAQKMAVRNIKNYGGTASAAAANRAASRTAAGNRYAASQAAKSDAAMSKAGVSGVGPVASGRTYATALKNTTQGIGPVASGSTYARSLEAEKKQQESARAAEAARQEQIRAADARRASAENARRIAAERAAAEAARKAEAERKRKAEEKRQRQFDSNRLEQVGTNDLSTDTDVADVFKKADFGPDFGQTNTDSGDSVASRTNPTGLGISTKASSYDPESTAFALRTGNFDPAAYDSFKAGGLNIGGSSAEASEGETTSGSATGRTITSTSRDKLGVGDYNPMAVAGRIVGGGIDKLTGDRTDFDNLGTAAENKNLSPTKRFEQFKKDPLQQAVFTAQTGVNADRVINEGGPAAKEIYNRYVSQIDSSTAKGARNPIARFFRDIGDSDATAMAGRAIDATMYNDPNFSDTPNQLTQQLSRFGVPQLSEENVQDIRHTFDKSVTGETGVQGKSMLSPISYTQAGGFANRILSGKVKDAVVESMDQQGTSTISPDQVLSIGQSVANNRATEGTVANQRFNEIQSLAERFGPGKGQAPTVPSILQRTIGAGTGRRSEGSTPNRGTGTTKGAIETTPVEELPINNTVSTTTSTQTGTDTSNLQQIQQQSYLQNLARLGITNLMQLPQFQRFKAPKKRGFRSFRRTYFNT